MAENTDDLLICLPIVSACLPHLLSVPDKCSLCGQAVWRALSSPNKVQAICVECAQRAIAQEGEIVVMPPTAKQINEVNLWLRTPTS